MLQSRSVSVARLRDERGFTLIELLTVCTIIAVLGAISLTSYMIYADKAEYTKAESALRNARTALEAGLQNMEGREFGLGGVSGSHGEPLIGDMQEALPGMVVPDRVRLMVNRFNCGEEGRVADVVIVWACTPGFSTSYVRTCQGVEIITGKLAVGRGFC